MRRGKFLSTVFGVLVSIQSFVACSGGGSAASSETTTASAVDIENSATAVAALFSGFSGSSGTSRDAKTKFTINSTGADICDDANRERGPTGVIMTPFGGTSLYPYGAATDSVTISDASYFCEDGSGNLNAGDGPDGDGKFVSFIFLGEPQGICDDGSSFSFTKGSGIVRNTQEHYPEIYGRFEIDDDSSQIVNCTLRLLENGTMDTARSSCTLDDGSAVSLSSSLSCTIDADLPEVAEPSYYKGHYGQSDEESSNLNTDCINATSVEDSDHIQRIQNDCSGLTDMGVNVEFISIMTVAYDTSANSDLSSWTIELAGTSHEQVRQYVQLLHASGLQVGLSVDFLYTSNPNNVSDGEDFPAALIDNAAFQDDLAAFILEEAAFAEEVGATLFLPLSESDRVFDLSAIDDDEFLEGIMDDLRTAYSGNLIYVAATELVDYTPQNLARFDFLGFTISPRGHDHFDAFIDRVETSLASQQSLVNDLNANYGGSLRHMITSLGVWGSASETEADVGLGEADWMDDATVATMFTDVFALSDAYGTSGLVAWEGIVGEFIFPTAPLTVDAITAGFLAR